MTVPAQPREPLSEDHDQCTTQEKRSEEDTRPGPDAADSSDSEVVEGESSALAVVLAQLKQLQTGIETKILDDEQQRQWFAQLTSELEDYRQDFIYKYVTSKVFRDLIQLYDTVDQTAQSVAQGTASTEAVVSRLWSLREQLLQTLSRQDVAPIGGAVGRPFDEAEQEAIDVRPVDRPEDDGTVVEVARLGFRYRQQLLRSESVIVGRYEPKNGSTTNE